MRSLSHPTSRSTRQNRSYALIIALLVVAAFAGCRRTEAPCAAGGDAVGDAQPHQVPLGAPMDITYRFVVAPDAPAFAENNRVFVHVVDTDEKLMWTDDHDPPTPTTEWKPGQTIEYVRTVFVPFVPTSAAPRFHVGLYSPTTQQRLTLSGRMPASAPTTWPAWTFCRKAKRCSPS